jgi:hypothetical protein
MGLDHIRALVSSTAAVSAVAGTLALGHGYQAQADELGKSAQQSIVYVYYDLPGSALASGRHIQGTGFVISKRGYLLTAAHLFEDWAKLSPTDQAAHPIQGALRSNPAFVHGVVFKLISVHLGDPKNEDVALFKIPEDQVGQEFPWAPICLSQQLPSVNDSLQAFGFPLDQDFQGKPVTLGKMDAQGGRWAADSPFTFGMSGGPVYWRGNVVGLVEGGVIQGGTSAEEAKWITPIRLAHLLLDMAEGFVEATASEDTIEDIFERDTPLKCLSLK